MNFYPKVVSHLAGLPRLGHGPPFFLVHTAFDDTDSMGITQILGWLYVLNSSSGERLDDEVLASNAPLL